MAKKSFFERLTGATKEPTDLPVGKAGSSKGIQADPPASQRGEPEYKIFGGEEEKKEPKKTSNPRVEKPKINKPEKQEKEEEKEKEKWPPEEEGQLTIDVYQTENDIVIKSTIAGVKSEDIDITITNDMITIKGLRRQDESMPQENYYYQELYWGPFSRSVILPVDVDTDKVKASMKNGILTIKLPKVEKAKTKTIRVREVE